MSKTVYIAGKISGLPREEVKVKFDTITKQLAEQGFEVINPLVVTDSSSSWDDAIRKNIKIMLECDEVHMLPDWKDSKGALIERDIAIRLGMPLTYH